MISTSGNNNNLKDIKKIKLSSNLSRGIFGKVYAFKNEFLSYIDKTL